MIVQVGPCPEPLGGISVYLKRLKDYMDSVGIKNQVCDISNTNDFTRIRLKLLFKMKRSFFGIKCYRRKKKILI